jgi:gluconolactonase
LERAAEKRGRSTAGRWADDDTLSNFATPGANQMDNSDQNRKPQVVLDRRSFLAAALGAVTVASAAAQVPGQLQVSPVPTPRDWSRQDPIQYPDPDIIALDDRFIRYIVRNTVIRRLHFGTLFGEGPAWNGVGRYLLWSDIPNNVQMRWIEEDGRVTAFRNPSGYSNGNTFDFEGRQLSGEGGGRRLVLLR